MLAAYMGSGIRAQVCMLTQQAFYLLSRLPTPTDVLLKFSDQLEEEAGTEDVLGQN